MMKKLAPMKKSPTDLAALLKIYGRTHKDVQKAIDVSNTTLVKYIRDPNSMTGKTRKKLADYLGIDVAEIDALCRGEFVYGFKIREGIQKVEAK